MEGGTSFHFVTEGSNAALRRAMNSAAGKDVRLGGGVATVREYLQAGSIDEMHIAVSPVMLGAGEHLFSGIDTPALGYTCTRHVATPDATHFVLTRQG
jgi:dihydrofolate reductase